MESALNRAKSIRVKIRTIDGENEAHLIALSCGDAPEGRSRWTLRWQNKEWCIPAKKNAEFVCAMEDTLEVYKRPYDEAQPLICMDESSKQQIKDTRTPIPGKASYSRSVRTEYERNGVSNVLCFLNPCRAKELLK